jgi:hypothetical protein
MQIGNTENARNKNFPRYEVTDKCVEVVVWFIDTFQLYPNMFQQFIAIIRGPWYLRSYSSNICVVDEYGLKFVQCGQLSRDTDHTGQIAIHIHPQHRYCLSKFWGTTPWRWQWTAERCWGKNLKFIDKLYYYFDAFVGYFITILQKYSVQLSRRSFLLANFVRNINKNMIKLIWVTHRWWPPGHVIVTTDKDEIYPGSAAHVRE